MATNAVVSACDSFASPNVRLDNDQFSDILSFFDPEELVRIERVCKSWKTFIDATGQWKKHCQHRLNLPSHIDPQSFLPAGWSYKKGSLLASPKVFDGRMYEYYLGADVGPVPPIPEEISLERKDELDPCDQTQTIGRNYTWLYCPKDFTFENSLFELDKPDDLNNKEAPRLIKKDGGKSEEKRMLAVPNTIYNIEELFKHPKKGHPSAFDYNNSADLNQHGNKRISSGWICMKEDVIGRSLSFPEQQEAANKVGVVIPPLIHRIILNFLKHVSSREANVYQDEKNPCTWARTSTPFPDLGGTNWGSGCGCGSSTGLRVGGGFTYSGNGPHVGAAVALPVKTQASDP